jgi:hypothetical protein
MANKRCFLVSLVDDEFCVAVVATSHNGAKSIASRDDYFMGCEYINLRACIRKEARIDDLPIGTVIYGIDGLKRGAYDLLITSRMDGVAKWL